MRQFLALACLATTLAGCHLVDQRDFDAHAGEKPEPPPGAPPKPGPGALLSIDYAAGTPDYAAPLAQAVHAALTAKPDVLFSVRATVPLSPTPEAQLAALGEAASSGREIAEAIVADGANTAQVEQSVRTEPGVHARQVQIFVQ